MTRTVIFHYHLFKNAGTSLDRILQKNFGDRWVTAEFPMGGNNNTALVEDWIRDTPQATAYSTHTAVGPLPQVEGVEIVPVMLLRDPIARIQSAYRFERKQQADTWGAQLAKTHDFEGYVRARLDRPTDRQCRNFQCARLASLKPGDAPELDRAKTAAQQITKHGVLGKVSQFDQTLIALQHRLSNSFPEFTWEATRANTTHKDSTAQDAHLLPYLAEHNQDDLTLCRMYQ